MMLAMVMRVSQVLLCSPQTLVSADAGQGDKEGRGREPEDPQMHPHGLQRKEKQSLRFKRLQEALTMALSGFLLEKL